MNKQKIFIQIGIIFTILIVLNLISQSLFFRIDYTADQRYTLSNATRTILKNLDEVVTIRAYFSKEIPPGLASHRADIQNMLVEYEKRSAGQVVYKIINPEEEEIQQEAQQEGIGPVILDVRTRNKRNQLQVYLGLVIEKGAQKEIIPFVNPNNSLEYNLTKAIKKVSIIEKPKIAFLQGHGEPPIDHSLSLKTELSLFYTVENYTIDESQEIPSDYKALIIIDPIDTLKQTEFNKLDNYLQTNGNIFLAYSGVKGDLNTLRLLTKNDIGIHDWLANKGIQMTKRFAIDTKCAAVSVRQQQGTFAFNSQINFPFFIVVSNFGKNPISENLEALILPFANPIEITSIDSNTNYMPLAYTSEQSGTVESETSIDVQKEWQENDFQESNQILAVAVENLFPNSTGRLVLVANDRFATEGESRQQYAPDNPTFALNAIDWLADDSGLINLRSKVITARPIKEDIEESTKDIIAYSNVFAPIFFILIYAFFRKQFQIKKRQNWIEHKY